MKRKDGKAVQLDWRKVRVVLLVCLLCLIYLNVMWVSAIQERSGQNDADAESSTHLPPGMDVVHTQTKQNHGDAFNVTHPLPLNRDRDSRLLNPVEVASELPVYSREMASQTIRPAPWTCGERDENVTDPLSNEKPIFAFVHVYKTAGSTVRWFFMKYSAVCRKSWMVLTSCSGVDPSSIRMKKDWKNCRVKEVVDERIKKKFEHDRQKKRLYPTVNNTVLKENIDIYGGHFRIGAGDHIFGSNRMSSNQPPVRHILFLRDPKARFVSGILYLMRNNNSKTLEDIAKKIKKEVRHGRKHLAYWEKSLQYLLTPDQAKLFANMNTTQFTPESKARMAIHNLVHYNVIVGMVERMPQSMTILQHVLKSDHFTGEKREEYIDGLFREFFSDDDEGVREEGITNSDTRMNISERKGVSTSSVLEDLRRDMEFMLIFEEYVKYEQIITDFAWKMHLLQYEMAVNRIKGQ